MNLRALHRASACVIAAFAAVHIANHLASLSSIATHIAFMEDARRVYRQPLVEALLVLCVTFQGLSGLWLVFSGWRQRQGTVAWLQAASGTYLALFLLIHVSAVFYGRSTLGLDTNFYYAAAGFHVPPFQRFFIPYYAAAVVALFTHLGCAVYWRIQAQFRGRPLVVIVPLAGGIVVAALIVLSLAGRIQPFEVPARYLQTYERAGG